MIVGWVAATATGVRLYFSERGRYFRDPATARSRERIVKKRHWRRSAAAWHRDPYLVNQQHLDDGVIRVRLSEGTPDRAA